MVNSLEESRMPNQSRWVLGGVAESVDARDLKSFGLKSLWGFKSPRPHPNSMLTGQSHGQSVDLSLRSWARDQSTP